MKTLSARRLPVFFLVATLALGGCASHPVASNRTRPNVASGSPDGAIPTKDSTRHSQYVDGHGVGGGTGPEYSIPTGSLIPQHYDRRGYITDTADPSFVYDQNDIRFQISDNVSDQLRTIPGVNVSGPR